MADAKVFIAWKAQIITRSHVEQVKGRQGLGLSVANVCVAKWCWNTFQSLGLWNLQKPKCHRSEDDFEFYPSVLVVCTHYIHTVCFCNFPLGAVFLKCCQHPWFWSGKAAIALIVLFTKKIHLNSFYVCDEGSVPSASGMETSYF